MLVETDVRREDRAFKVAVEIRVEDCLTGTVIPVQIEALGVELRVLGPHGNGSGLTDALHAQPQLLLQLDDTEQCEADGQHE